MRDLVRYLLMYVVLPMWVLAGLLDWWCHKRTAIEATSGGRESAFHWIMFGQLAVGGLASMLLQVNLGLLVLLVVLFVLHECTTWLELRFVIDRRHISPAEQMIHSFMELLPLAAILMLAGLYDGSGEWTLRLKNEPLPAAFIGVSIVAITVLNVIPLGEEAWRCCRVPRDQLTTRAGS